MAKVIRPTYPREFSIGMLILIFAISSFLSFEIFNTTWHDVLQGGSPLLGMVLAGIAVVIMALVLWEEFLFPVRIKPNEDEIIFRNHLTKLKTQVMIYCTIPVIVGIVYFTYEVSYVPFLIWAAICLVVPVAGKLLSGIRNYNDFLKISNDAIAYKNNEKHGVFPIRDVQAIVLQRDESNILHKIHVTMRNNDQVVIDLDEMELEDYLQTIDEFVQGHYKSVLR